VNFNTILRPTRSLDDVATIEQRERADQAQQLRQARVATARRTDEWVEVPQSHLVRRGPFWIDAETDAVFTHRPGAVFDHGRAEAPYSLTQTRLHFFVSDDNTVEFLESTAARTWSQMLERKHEKQRRHAERQAAFRAERQRIIAGR